MNPSSRRPCNQSFFNDSLFIRPFTKLLAGKVPKIYFVPLYYDTMYTNLSLPWNVGFLRAGIIFLSIVVVPAPINVPVTV